MIEYFSTQNLIEKMVSSRIVPGVNYAFIKGEQVFTSTVGFSTWVPENVQLSPFAQYDLASLTKVLGTTTVFLQLYEQGRLNFTEPLQQFIPTFKDKRVRLSHLLTHTSGIRGYIENRDQLDAQELIAALIDLPVTAEFDKKVRYSDTNFILLGLVLEVLFDKPVWQIITEQVITPMNLQATTFYPDKNNCVPTTMQEDGTLVQGVVHDPKARVLQEHCGSAGLFSDLNDLVLMAQGYLGLNRKILPLKQDTIADLYTPKTSPRMDFRSWGFDMVFDPIDQHAIILHTGYTGTLIVLDRLMQTGMILLTNRVHPSGNNQIFITARQKIIASFLDENRK